MVPPLRLTLALAALLAGATALSPPARAQASLMRFPNASMDRIVFVAHGNLWTVPKSGGTATRLTADPGQDVLPRFSPDGKWIAYTATDQGNQDIYVIPAAGGEARRLTFHSDVVAKAPTRWGPDNMVVTWTPDSKAIVFLSRRASWNPSVQYLFQVPVAGGLPTRLPMTRGGFLSFGPNDHTVAFADIFRDFRTWKRYDGGRAPDIYTYDFQSRALTRITDWKGADTQPMWAGRRIYFVSDRDAKRRANIWVYDQDTKQTRQVTRFTDMDVDFASLGAGTITFQQGGRLWAIDLPSETLRAVAVDVPDDGTRTMPRWVKVGGQIRARDTARQVDYAIAPNGGRAAFSARGDLFTVPAEHGAIRDLTRTSNADEDHPAWSPDGRTLAYTTDASGSQQLAIRPAAGGPERLLTRFATGFLYTPVWSPDGHTLAVPDASHALWLVDTDGTSPRRVAQDQAQEIHDPAFSPDGKWLAYSTVRTHNQREIHLYEIAAGQDAVVSLATASDSDPVFSPDGRYLFFISQRHELPAFSESEFNVATVKAAGIYAATLSADTPSPFAPRSDEGVPVPPPAADGARPPAHGPYAAGDTAPAPGSHLAPPIRVALAGLMQRVVPVPVPPADIDQLDARGSRLFYRTEAPSLIEGSIPGEKPALHVYDLEARKDETVVDGLDGDALSADGKRVLYRQGHVWHIADAKPGHGDDHVLPTGEMLARIDPRQEWAEMFENAWRLERDLFVDSKMNGDDWKSVHDDYARLLPLLGSRDDLTFLIGEMQGELGNSHTYVTSPMDDGDPTPRVPTALLGADYALDAATGRYRFARIYAGDDSREGYRGPLSAPGLGLHEGDYLLAVDGQELRPPADPYSLFVGLSGPVTLTVAASASAPSRDVTVDPVSDELSVREQDWIDRNRTAVDRLSGGRVGYIYLSDMESLGMEQFVRQFYTQLGKQALLVDDRWNNGGFIDQIVLERLRRVLVGMGTNREGLADETPREFVDGPKAVLMNHYSASDGDIFPYYFRRYGLGRLYGTRTWGGVRGIRGNWGLLDGGSITIPEHALYGTDSRWVIENHGVDPDVTVEDVPSEAVTGRDIQLETAVKGLTDQLDAHPQHIAPPPAPLPAYPADGDVPPASR